MVAVDYLGCVLVKEQVLHYQQSIMQRFTINRAVHGWRCSACDRPFPKRLRGEQHRCKGPPAARTEAAAAADALQVSFDDAGGDYDHEDADHSINADQMSSSSEADIADKVMGWQAVRDALHASEQPPADASDSYASSSDDTASVGGNSDGVSYAPDVCTDSDTDSSSNSSDTSQQHTHAAEPSANDAAQPPRLGSFALQIALWLKGITSASTLQRVAVPTIPFATTLSLCCSC